MQTSNSLYTVFCCALTLVLSACDQHNVSDLQAYVANVQTKQHAGIEPLPNLISYAAYDYDETDLRNPFNPIAPVGPTVTQCTQVIRKRDALEEIPLEALAMVGSLEQDGERWALIRTQDGTIHRRKTLDYIGKDNGHIRKITENSIELLETIPQGSGCVKKTTLLTLND